MIAAGDDDLAPMARISASRSLDFCSNSFESFEDLCLGRFRGVSRFLTRFRAERSRCSIFAVNVETVAASFTPYATVGALHHQSCREETIDVYGQVFQSGSEIPIWPTA